MARIYLKDRQVVPQPGTYVPTKRTYLKDRAASGVPLVKPMRANQEAKPERFARNLANAQAGAGYARQQADRAGSFMGLARNTLAGLPSAIGTLGKEAVRHPANTVRSIASGVYQGGIKPIVKLPTYLAGQKGQQARRGLDLIGADLAGNQNQVQQDISSGFKFAGAVAPYEVAGNLAARALPQAPRIANLAGWLGGGQLAYEGENTFQGRGKQALSDTALFGLTKLLSGALGKLKTTGEAAPYVVPNVVPEVPKVVPKASPRVVANKQKVLPQSDPLLSQARKYTTPEMDRWKSDSFWGKAIKPDASERTVSITDIGDGKVIGIRQKGVTEKGVQEWISKIKNGERPAILVGNRPMGKGEITVLDGNHTLDAYRRLGVTEVPIIDNTGGKLTDLWKKAQGGTKPSGLISTIRNSPEYSQDMAKNLEGAGGYTPRKQTPLVKEAQRTIVKNFSEAERIATTESSDRATIMADQLAKHLDTIAQEAKSKGDTATFDFAMNKAKEIALKTDINLRESGRAISAANQFNKQSPEGMMRTLLDIAEQKGAKLNLSNEAIYNFQRKAEALSLIPDARQRALKTFELMDEVYDGVKGGAKDKILQALNLPRAIMATADLSAPLRQGIFTMARNPKTFAKNFGNMFKYAFSEDAYRNLKADIVTSPNYNLYVKYKLPLTDISKGLDAREEMFMSNWVDKIPLFGKLSKGSNRAYSGFLNKMRVDLFDDFVKTGKLNNITDPKYLEDAARFVGSATGRGNIAKFLGGEQSGKVFNSFFFSPRLMSSRFSLMNPKYYVDLHPAVRKEALKSLLAFVGTGTGILTLAKVNGAEVGTDPRSADFGKIKIGNTRYDTWGGFQQYARLLGQLITGEMVSTVTGKETQLGEGYNAPTRLDIIARFFQSKENPVASFLTTLATGKTGLGDDANIPAEVIDRFIPMLAQDAADLMREYGPAKGAAMAIPGMFGVGSQTYGDQIPMMSRTTIGNPSIKWRQEPNLGESLLNTITGTELSNIPKEQWAPLADERLAEQKRQIEMNKAKQEVLLTGEPKYVGDTLIFLDNGVVKTKTIKVTPRTPLQSELKKNYQFYTK